MIIDLQRFITEEKRHWTALEAMLDGFEREPERRLTLDEAKRFHYLYQRTSADLAKIATFASDPDTHRYLESLVARAYGEVHEMRRAPHRLIPLQWFFVTLPRVFRRHIKAFLLSLFITLAGVAFGGMAKNAFGAAMGHAAAKGYKWADMSLTGEDNPDTWDLAHHMGAKIYKRYRFYRKEI